MRFNRFKFADLISGLTPAARLPIAPSRRFILIYPQGVLCNASTQLSIAAECQRLLGHAWPVRGVGSRATSRPAVNQCKPSSRDWSNPAAPRSCGRAFHYARSRKCQDRETCRTARESVSEYRERWEIEPDTSSKI